MSLVILKHLIARCRETRGTLHMYCIWKLRNYIDEQGYDKIAELLDDLTLEELRTIIEAKPKGPIYRKIIFILEKHFG